MSQFMRHNNQIINSIDKFTPNKMDNPIRKQIRKNTSSGEVTEFYFWHEEFDLFPNVNLDICETQNLFGISVLFRALFLFLGLSSASIKWSLFRAASWPDCCLKPRFLQL